MPNNKIEEEFNREGILKVISNELAGLELSTGDYIQIANSILDSALEKNPVNQSAEDMYNRKLSELPIVSEGLSIRACDPQADFEIFEQWTGDQRGREFLLSRLENNIEEPGRVLQNPANIFGIVCNASEKPIGIVGFLNFDQKQKKAELRKLIGEPDYRGKGLGKKASNLWLSYGLYGLNLRKIYLYTFDSNLRNIRINEELGFKLEGVFREEHIIDGEPRDILRMSLICSQTSK